MLLLLYLTVSLDFCQTTEKLREKKETQSNECVLCTPKRRTKRNERNTEYERNEIFYLIIIALNINQHECDPLNVFLYLRVCARECVRRVFFGDEFSVCVCSFIHKMHLLRSRKPNNNNNNSNNESFDIFTERKDLISYFNGNEIYTRSMSIAVA